MVSGNPQITLSLCFYLRPFLPNTPQLDHHVYMHVVNQTELKVCLAFSC